MSAYRIGSLCSGYGGLDTAARQVFGGRVAWVADPDPGAAAILAHHWPDVPNLGDITTVNWHKVEPVDVLVGGYPCQPFSTAGKRKGNKDARHIWPFVARALGVLRPRYAVFENVANHLRLGFDTVLCDLADLGFDVEWCVVRADEVGAPHQRRRLFILATATDASGPGLEVGTVQHHEPQRSAVERSGGQPAANAPGLGRGEGRPEPTRQQRRPGPALSSRATPAHTHSDGREGQQRSGPGLGARGDADGRGAKRWGRFGLAVARWEAVTDRRSPWATDSRERLNPAFVEWMMGLSEGHVTAVPGLTRTQQLQALGNGVVPQQAAAALRLLVERAQAEVAPPLEADLDGDCPGHAPAPDDWRRTTRPADNGEPAY